MAEIPPEPLRDDRIVAKPKLVKKATTFNDFTGLLKTEPYLTDLTKVMERIEKGLELDPRFYRPSMDEVEDQLLQRDGYKHLHLGGQRSDVLLFLVEYEDFVVLAEVNGHHRFASDPPGSALRAIHDSAVRQAAVLAGADADEEKEKAAKKAKREEQLRLARLKARKPRTS